MKEMKELYKTDYELYVDSLNLFGLETKKSIKEFVEWKNK